MIHCPPGILDPARALVTKRGLDPTDEELFDLLVSVGLEVLAEHPEALEGLERFAGGDLGETFGLHLPALERHPRIAALRRILGGSRAGSCRVAAAVGTLALGLPICLRSL